jgi:hypothetical protein
VEGRAGVTALLRIARAICESGSNLFNRLRRHSRVAPTGMARAGEVCAGGAPRTVLPRAGRWDLRARSDMGLGLLFSFQKKNSMEFLICKRCPFICNAASAQSIKAATQTLSIGCSRQAKLWFTNLFYTMFMFD